MRKTAYIASAATLAVLLLSGDALAEGRKRQPEGLANAAHLEFRQRRRGAAPYGDFCPRCNSYGVGRRAVSKQVAFHALTEYFADRGFEIRDIRGRGRFLKVDIYKDGKLVDRILFDRRTGRIRSIY